MFVATPFMVDCVKRKLDQFRPTKKYHQHVDNNNIAFSPGVSFLAEQTGGHWLIDAIASKLFSEQVLAAMQSDVRLRTHQEWSLYVIHDVGMPEVLEGRADIYAQPFLEEYLCRERAVGECFPLVDVQIHAVRDGDRWLLVLPLENPNFMHPKPV